VGSTFHGGSFHGSLNQFGGLDFVRFVDGELKDYSRFYTITSLKAF
jgi:hypothetical protein